MGRTPRHGDVKTCESRERLAQHFPHSKLHVAASGAILTTSTENRQYRGQVLVLAQH